MVVEVALAIGALCFADPSHPCDARFTGFCNDSPVPPILRRLLTRLPETDAHDTYVQDAESPALLKTVHFVRSLSRLHAVSNLGRSNAISSDRVAKSRSWMTHYSDNPPHLSLTP